MNKNSLIKLFCFSFFFFLIFTPCSSLQAQQLNDRKGFFLSLGPLFGGELRISDQVVAGMEMRLGAGITEKTLLYAESSFNYTSHQGVNYIPFLEQAKVQHFVYQELYFNFGVGLAVGDIAPISAPTTIATKIGVSSSVGLGYEFRPKKSFAVSPEIGLYYHHLGDSQDFFTALVMLNMGWYF